MLCVAITHDNKFLLSGSSDNTVRLWELNKKKQRFVFKGHTSSVKSIIITSDNKHAISASADKTLRGWDIAHKTPEFMFSCNSPVYCLSFAVEERYFVAGLGDNTVRIWDLQGVNKFSVMPGHNGSVLGVALTGKTDFLLTSASDCTVRLWNIKLKQEIAVIDGCSGKVTCGIFMESLNYLIFGIDDYVILRNLKNKGIAKGWKAHEGEITSLATTSDMKLLVSAGMDFIYRIWISNIIHHDTIIETA